MTSPTDREGSLDEGGIFLPEMTAVYRSRPRGSSGTTFEPGRLRPQWRWAIISIVLIGLTATAGLLYRVPAGSVATVLGVNGQLVVLALASADLPKRGDVIELETSDHGVVRVLVHDGQQGGGPSALVVMALVEVQGAPTAPLAINEQLRVRGGTRPLLVDVLMGGG
jgi:hypothetical protein